MNNDKQAYYLADPLVDPIANPIAKDMVDPIANLADPPVLPTPLIYPPALRARERGCAYWLRPLAVAGAKIQDALQHRWPSVFSDVLPALGRRRLATCAAITSPSRPSHRRQRAPPGGERSHCGAREMGHMPSAR
jgi:hypothetical protein